MMIFGSIGVFRRYIPLSSAFIAFTRGILGGLFLFLLMRISGKGSKEKISARNYPALVISGAVIAVNWILLFEAYNHTTVAVATLCYYMQPTIVMLLSPLIFKERMTVKKAICAAAAVVGMALVSGVIGTPGAHAGSVRGILLGLGAAVCYSAVIIMNKKTGGIDTYRKTTVELLSAGIIMIPYLFITNGFANVELDVKTLILLLIVGILHTGIAYPLYFGSMKGLSVQSVAILSYADPVSALVFSAVFLKEPIGVPCMIGAVMIIGSAIFMELRE